METCFLKFQTRPIIGTIDDEILLDGRIGWVHEGTSEIKVTWRRKEQATLGTASILTTHECH
jgi:hypothetical protein